MSFKVIAASSGAPAAGLMLQSATTRRKSWTGRRKAGSTSSVLGNLPSRASPVLSLQGAGLPLPPRKAHPPCQWTSCSCSALLGKALNPEAPSYGGHADQDRQRLHRRLRLQGRPQLSMRHTGEHSLSLKARQPRVRGRDRTWDPRRKSQRDTTLHWLRPPLPTTRRPDPSSWPDVPTSPAGEDRALTLTVPRVHGSSPSYPMQRRQ